MQATEYEYFESNPYFMEWLEKFDYSWDCEHTGNLKKLYAAWLDGYRRGARDSVIIEKQ